MTKVGRSLRTGGYQLRAVYELLLFLFLRDLSQEAQDLITDLLKKVGEKQAHSGSAGLRLGLLFPLFSPSHSILLSVYSSHRSSTTPL